MISIYSDKFCCDGDERLYNLVVGKWNDVRQKGKRLRDNGHVHDYKIEKNGALVQATVDGDNGRYLVQLYRMTFPMKKTLLWQCDCPWGRWAFKRQHTFIGRMCSHALAVMYETYGNDFKRNIQDKALVSADGIT